MGKSSKTADIVAEKVSRRFMQAAAAFAAGALASNAFNSRKLMGNLASSAWKKGGQGVSSFRKGVWGGDGEKYLDMAKWHQGTGGQRHRRRSRSRRRSRRRRSRSRSRR